jgi:hypothetical protein
MNFENAPSDIDNLDTAIVPSIVPVDINVIHHNQDPAAIDRICCSDDTMVVPVAVDLSVGTMPELIDNSVIDWDHVVDVHSVVIHNHLDNIFDDNNVDNEFFNFLQDDPNPVVHTSGYDVADSGEDNHHDDMNNDNHADRDVNHDIDIFDCLS